MATDHEEDSVILEASTPASLASTPRASAAKPSPLAVLQRAAQKLGAVVDERARHHGADDAASRAQALCLQARRVHSDAASVLGVMHLVRGHLAALQQQLGEVQQEAERQRHLADIRVMEKDCEARLAQSEATSYKLAARARGAAVATLQAAVSGLSQEREQLASQVAVLQSDMEAARLDAAQAKNALAASTADLDAMSAALQASTQAGELSGAEASKLKEAVAALQQQLSSAQQTIAALQAEQQQVPAAMEEQAAALQQLLRAAQSDAADAAGQLVEACEENARLSETLAGLELQLGEWEEEAEGGRLREQEHQDTNRQLAIQNGQLRSALEAAHAEAAGLKRLVRALRGGGASAPTSSGALQAPSGAGGARDELAAVPPGAAASGADVGDDLLAAELLQLQQHNARLQAQLEAATAAAAATAALGEQAVALRSENAALQGAVGQSADDATRARQELQQAQRDAQALHSQLSEVITGLAATGLNSALHLPLLLQSAAADRPAAAPAPPPLPPAPTSVAAAAQPPLSLQPWRGPATPTSGIPPVGAAGRAPRHAGSDSDSDVLLAELRHAMTALDGSPAKRPAPSAAQALGSASASCVEAVSTPAVRGQTAGADQPTGLADGIAYLTCRAPLAGEHWPAAELQSGAGSVTPFKTPMTAASAASSIPTVADDQFAADYRED